VLAYIRIVFIRLPENNDHIHRSVISFAQMGVYTSIHDDLKCALLERNPDKEASCSPLVFQGSYELGLVSVNMTYKSCRARSGGKTYHASKSRRDRLVL